MKLYRPAAMERTMKIQEVILRAVKEGGVKKKRSHLSFF